jgi:hypothetical protein
VKILCWTWGSHSDNYEEYHLLRCYTVQSSRGLMFWKNILPPSSGMKSMLSKQPARSTARLANPSTLQMETVYYILESYCVCEISLFYSVTATGSMDTPHILLTTCFGSLSCHFTFTCIHLLVFLHWPVFTYWYTVFFFFVICNGYIYKMVCSPPRLNINC